MDRSEIPQDPDVNWDFSKSRPQVIRSHWVYLWCSPSAVCNQSAEGGYREGLQFTCSGSRHHQLALWVFYFGENLGWVCLRFLLASFHIFCLPPVHWLPLHLWFLGLLFFVRLLILIESAGGCGFYSHHHFLGHQRPVCFNPFVRRLLQNITGNNRTKTMTQFSFRRETDHLSADVMAQKSDSSFRTKAESYDYVQSTWVESGEAFRTTSVTEHICRFLGHVTTSAGPWWIYNDWTTMLCFCIGGPHLDQCSLIHIQVCQGRWSGWE